jgi:CRISPR system Cascade subunit CasE
MYFTRVTIRRPLDDRAVADLVEAMGRGSALASHHLIWTLFSDAPDRERDFLWREGPGGVFYLLSRRAPVDRLGVFEMEEPKSFSPNLRIGDRLHFALRVNATISRRAEGSKERGRIHDIVCDALQRAGTDQRGTALVRRNLLHPVARTWLSARGVKRGFSLVDATPDSAEGWEFEERDPFRVLGYHRALIDRGDQAPMRVGIMDLEGELVVRDPVAFLAALHHGFGRAKAFGCGLMLVRRAR